jgi:acetyl esterase/lipase
MSWLLWLLAAVLALGAVIVVRPFLDMRSVPRVRAFLRSIGFSKQSTTLRLAFNLVASQFLVGLVVLEVALHIVAGVIAMAVGLGPSELSLQLTIALTAVCVALLSLYVHAYVQMQRRIAHALKAAGIVAHVHAVEHHKRDMLRDFVHHVLLLPALFTRLPGRGIVVVERDIRFHHDHERLTLDVFTAPSRHRRPILLFFHGGSWRGGSKAMAPPLLHYLALRGWCCVSAQYRLIPTHAFPDNVIDVKRCINWLRRHCDRFNADPGKLVIAGCSAGGHLAAIAALTPGVAMLQPGFEDADCSVHGVIAMHVPLDLRKDGADPDNQLEQWLERTMIQKAAHEAPALFDLVSPMVLVERLATAQIPPFFVVHGAADSLVPVDQAQRFVDHLRKRACPVVYVEAPLGQHSFDLLHTPRALLLCRAIHLWTSTLVPR